MERVANFLQNHPDSTGKEIDAACDTGCITKVLSDSACMATASAKDGGPCGATTATTERGKCAPGVQPAQRLQKAREAFEAARLEDFEARQRAAGAAGQLQTLKANTYRRAADLADPRIDDLRRWVLRLNNAVRCEEVEEVLPIYFEGRNLVFRTRGVTGAVLLQSMNELDAIVNDLDEMLKTPLARARPRSKASNWRRKPSLAA